jgi:hypothetical protein
LVTVKSCPAHNNAKSKDDLYVLAQICMHASPANRAREVWLTKVAPQLEFNGGKLRDMLAEGAVQVEGGLLIRFGSNGSTSSSRLCRVG